VHFLCLRRRSSTVCSGLHTTPDSFRLSQCPLAASTPAPGPPHQFLQRHLLREQFGLIRVAPGLFRQQVWRQFRHRQLSLSGLPLPSLSTSRYPVRWYGPLRVLNIPATGRRIWVCTLPLIEEQANQSPLAAFLQHQDLVSVGRPRCRGTFSDSFWAAVSVALATSPRRPPPSCD